MRHKYMNAVEFMEDLSLPTLCDRANEFCKDHEVLNVGLTAADHCLKGTGLRASDYEMTYMASIMYRKDLTEELVNEELDKWVMSKLKDFKAPSNGFDVMTGLPVSSKDSTMAKIDYLTHTDEFMELKAELEAKHSLPEPWQNQKLL